MSLQLSTTKSLAQHKHIVVLTEGAKAISGIDKAIATAAQKQFDAKQGNMYRQTGVGESVTIIQLETSKGTYINREKARKAGHSVFQTLTAAKTSEIAVFDASKNSSLTECFLEGLMLSSYEFNKYKTLDKKTKSLKKVFVDAQSIDAATIKKLEVIVNANFFARDLVNEPLSYLTAVQLGKEIEKAGKKFGFKVNVLNKKQIASLKMGGLLAVNKGSQDPPTFSILEYKPAKAKNKQPIVLVGKGVVYDTGGLSLKPTPSSMDMMKCDMSGAATVAGVFQAVASLKLPIHIVGLIPATDNRPGENAYVPGDVVTMMSGLNVEMLNADAEGRMILADALHYAKKYKPELVLDFATLTGASARAIGHIASSYMGTASEAVMNKLEQSANQTYERLIHFPLWEEYGDWIKSDVADIKNVGGAEAGHITAGKFLEHFTNYPWVHFDIAGSAYVMREDSYRGKYATAVGVRMITDFLSNY